MNLSDYVNTFGKAMLHRYGERVHKIAIDASFTCPNRDGTIGRGGCTFCNNVSFSPNGRSPDPLVEQIADSKSIGLFTKLALKQDSKDLLKKMSSYHSGIGDSSLEELHERYNVMVHKLIIVIRKKDKELAGSVADARDNLWDVLSDETKFSRM